MTSPARDPAPAARLEMDASAYGPAWRVVRGTLIALAGVSLPSILVLVVVATNPPVTPPILLRLVTLFALLPALAAHSIRRALRVEVTRAGDLLALQRRDGRLEVPLSAVARVRPWALPLPGPGLTLQMRSGRQLRWQVEAMDPTPLVHALAETGIPDAATHPVMVYAHAREASGPWRWYHLALKFPVFGLLATAPLFNVHQHIAYGALLGEYYLLGLRSYLTTFAVYWSTVTIYLILWASLWRGMAEALALLAAHVVPARAATMRRGVATACRVLYYGGVPLVLALRFLPGCGRLFDFRIDIRERNH